MFRSNILVALNIETEKPSPAPPKEGRPLLLGLRLFLPCQHFDVTGL